MDRLSGKQPLKRQYSVPALARRIGAPLPTLKRIIRGQEEASPNTLTRLARDLGLPAAELRAVLEEQGPVATHQSAPGLTGVLRSGDPLKQLEAGLIESARAFVQLLRNFAAGPPKSAPKSATKSATKRAAKTGNRRKRR